MQMEIDMPTTSMGHRASKRGRSPDDMGSPSRASKRYMMSPQEDRLYPIFLSTGSASSGSRSTSEDWVQQASGLTIESHNGPIDSSASTTAMQAEPVMTPSVPSKPQLAPLRTSFDYKLTPSYPNNPLHSQMQTQMDTNHLHPQSSSHSQPHLHPHRPFPAELPPSINVLPPTPDVIVNPGFTRSSSPTLDVSMSISNSPVTGISSPSRRQKFTMGPRAGCEKCRLGVKGHSVHLD